MRCLMTANMALASGVIGGRVVDVGVISGMACGAIIWPTGRQSR
jgi:hypothetical protein